MGHDSVALQPKLDQSQAAAPAQVCMDGGGEETKDLE